MSDPIELLIERPNRILLTDFADLLARPPAPWQIRGVLRECSVAMLYGRRGSYKSFVALDLGASLAAGVPWQGHEVVQPGLVIYVAAEGGGGMVQRARAWVEQHAITPRSVNMKFVTEPVVMTTDSDDVEILIHRIHQAIGWHDEGEIDSETGHVYEHPRAREWPVLIIIDTVARCFYGDENAPEDMGMFVQTVDRLKMEFNCSLLLVHHTGRDEAHERGHTSLPGACETIFKLEADDQTDALSFICEKMKDGSEPAPVELVHHQVAVSRRPCDDPNEDLTSVIIESERTNREEREQFLLDILRDAGPQSWVQWFEHSGLPRTTFGRFVVGLRETGKITKENGLWSES